jgi:anti-sigma factor RsiW
VGTCKTAQKEALSAYLDGMLDGEELRAMGAHLRVCADCTKALADMNAVKSLMAAAKAPSDPPMRDFWAGAYRAARVETARRSDLGKSRLPWGTIPGRLKLTVVASGLAALCLLSITLSRPHNPNVEPLRSTMTAASTLDVPSLVRAHADYAAQQPLADDPRLTMLMSDAAANGTQDNGADATIGDLSGNAATSSD